MNYIKEISKNVQIVNSVFDEIKIPRLLENPDFIVDEMSMESWLKVKLKDKEENNISMSLTFTRTGLEVSLDRVVEALDWSNVEIEKSNALVKSMIKNLLTCHVLVEYYGLYRTRISLFGKDGKCLNSFNYQEGFSFGSKRKIRLCFPFCFFRVL